MLTKATSEQVKAKARLSEIKVHEVSLVDRAANRKRFLIVKRAVPVAKAPPYDTVPPPPFGPQPADTPAIAQPGPQNTSAGGAAATVPALAMSAKSALTEGLVKAMQELTEVLAEVKGIAEAPEGTEPVTPTDLVDKINEVADDLHMLPSQCGLTAPEETMNEPNVQQPAPATPADTTGSAVPSAVPAPAVKGVAVPVDKANKLSKMKLNKLKDSMAEIMHALLDAVIAGEEGEKAKEPPEAEAEPEEMRGGAQAVAPEEPLQHPTVPTDKALDAVGTPEAPATKPGAAAPALGTPVLAETPQVAPHPAAQTKPEMSEEMKRLDSAIKAQAAQLAKMANASGVSHSMVPETSSAPTGGANPFDGVEVGSLGLPDLAPPLDNSHFQRLAGKR